MSDTERATALVAELRLNAAARRSVSQHLVQGFRNLCRGSSSARVDFAWAWERFSKTGDYAPDGYFAAFGIRTEDE